MHHFFSNVSSTYYNNTNNIHRTIQRLIQCATKRFIGKRIGTLFYLWSERRRVITRTVLLLCRMTVNAVRPLAIVMSTWARLKLVAVKRIADISNQKISGEMHWKTLAEPVDRRTREWVGLGDDRDGGNRDRWVGGTVPLSFPPYRQPWKPPGYRCKPLLQGIPTKIGRRSPVIIATATTTAITIFDDSVSSDSCLTRTRFPLSRYLQQ